MAFAPSASPSHPGDTVYGVAYGGYGFLSGSEAEADQITAFGCTPSDLRSYASSACSRQAAPSDDLALHDFIRDNLAQGALQALRDKLYEYSVLSLASASVWATGCGTPPPAEPARPSCVSVDSSGTRVFRMVRDNNAAVLARNAQSLPQSSRESSEETLLYDKFRSVAGGMQTSNLVLASALADQMANAFSLLQCVCYMRNGLNACTSTWGGTPSPNVQCEGISNQQLRLRTAYPALAAMTEAQRALMRGAIRDVVGADAAAQSGAAENRALIE